MGDLKYSTVSSFLTLSLCIYLKWSLTRIYICGFTLDEGVGRRGG